MMRVVSWFSCGTASATATKLALAEYGAAHEVVVARCVVPEEHEDNDRFAADCAAWFGQKIVNLRSAEYASCEDVWTRRRYMSGPKGAVCTIEMKKAVRWAFEREWCPDLQVFGYTTDERVRVDRFRAQNPDVNIVCPLIDGGLDKADCHAMVEAAGIMRPFVYRAGFANANCLGCVNAQSPDYWALTRHVFPEVFAARAGLSRKLGVRLIKRTSGKRERMFLDELPADHPIRNLADAPECGLLCGIARHKLAEAA